MSHKLATDSCFWSTGCSDWGRCRAFGSCVARWQNEHKDEILVAHGSNPQRILETPLSQKCVHGVFVYQYCQNCAIAQYGERALIFSQNDVNALVAMAIEKCARKCSEYEDYHWKLYQANPNSQQAWDHQTRANAAANCESAILALRSEFLPQPSANASATKGTGVTPASDNAKPRK